MYYVLHPGLHALLDFRPDSDSSDCYRTLSVTSLRRLLRPIGMRWIRQSLLQIVPHRFGTPCHKPAGHGDPTSSH